MADKEPTPMQKKVLSFFATLNGWEDFRKVAEKYNMKASSMKTALYKLQEVGYMSKEDGTSNWVITQEGMNYINALMDNSEDIPQDLDEDEGDYPPPPPPKRSTGQPWEQQVDDIIENHDLDRRPDPPPLPRQEEPEYDEFPREGRKKSLEEMGLTEYQLFMRMGKQMGGMTHDKVAGIAEVVFGQDPYNLEKVWEVLSGMNVPIDLRKQWFWLWQTYLKGAKNIDVPDSLRNQVNPPEKRTPEQVKEMQAKGKDWDITQDPETGIWMSANVGGGLGEFTFPEANKEVIARNTALTSLVRNSGGFPQEPVSQLLTSLAPYLNQGNGGGDSVSAVLTALAPYLNREGNGDNTVALITALIPLLTQQTNGAKGPSFIEQLPMYAEALRTFSPIVRSVLGIPTAPAAPQQPQQTAISLVDGNGNPMQMNLSDLITLKKFENKERRADESAKGRQEMVKGVKDFMAQLGNAAAKASNQL